MNESEDREFPALGNTPGTTYVIQARAVIKTGYTDYGQPVLHMVI